jgi:hypothetical protein
MEIDMNKEIQADAETAFAKWQESNPDVVKQVKAAVLEDLRKNVFGPDWQPHGMLSGGGWWFHVAMQKALREKFKEAPD